MNKSIIVGVLALFIALLLGGGIFYYTFATTSEIKKDVENVRSDVENINTEITKISDALSDSDDSTELEEVVEDQMWLPEISGWTMEETFVGYSYSADNSRLFFDLAISDEWSSIEEYRLEKKELEYEGDDGPAVTVSFTELDAGGYQVLRVGIGGTDVNSYYAIEINDYIYEFRVLSTAFQYDELSEIEAVILNTTRRYLNSDTSSVQEGWRELTTSVFEPDANYKNMVVSIPDEWTYGVYEVPGQGSITEYGNIISKGDIDLKVYFGYVDTAVYCKYAPDYTPIGPGSDYYDYDEFTAYDETVRVSYGEYYPSIADVCVEVEADYEPEPFFTFYFPFGMVRIEGITGPADDAIPEVIEIIKTMKSL